MKNPRRSELGNVVATIPRPISTMLGWVIASVAIVILFALSSATSINQTIGAAVVAVVFLFSFRTLTGVTIFENGLESNGARMRWEKLVAYRLSWSLGAQKIILIEQATKRELPMYLNVFESDTFRSAVGGRADLDALVKVGLP